MKFTRALAAAFDIAAVAAIGYAAVAIVCAARFARREPEAVAEGDLPPVTLLVPLHGDEPGLEENLRSFALQDYPSCQMVLGVARADDRALEIARRLAADLPDRNIEINVGEVPARNPKIANVLSMMRLARNDVLILADSDTRVDPAYVRSVTAPLREPAVGAVTCPFAGYHDGTLSARLGAMFINEQFIPSVLVNRLLGPARHCLGPTNAVRSAVLSAIGGFEALAPHLADDYMLGNRVAARGLRVVLSPYVVQTIVSDPSLAVLWNHELRWHRTIRGVQPAGYAGMFLTYPLPLALAAFLLAPSRKRFTRLCVAAIARIVLQRVAARALGVEPAPAWLVPLRDLFGMSIWLCGLGGNAIRWRDADLHIEAGDVLAERPG